ncbi:ABC transporter ATP-binding protein [Martelella soudanensis]|uniref:ABC transporter ATP-binding protein n=1 Tax=unclassified Martelella TaxID=2629616 RepID=UPI0015DDEF64|nr:MULTISPECIES: ABC transporter ATP-binding protein [unclassified Martelella]
MTDVKVRNLCRRYGAFVALDDVSFDVQSGEFLTLLGPSGCGKSTTLSALAGLDRPTLGTITIGEREVFNSDKNLFIDAQFRNLGLMFQSYALWPHMNVFENLDFALEVRKVRGATARERIHEALTMVDMDAYAERYPAELSGGQQQRVALARTLVYRPDVLLLDEPLSNLDAKLREKARLWLGDLQRRTGVTMVFVTHDQAEALSLSDRIIVMNRGKIAQIGTPNEVYKSPADPFVADFVGASNLLRGRLRKKGAGRVVQFGETSEIRVDAEAAGNLPEGDVVVSIRPEVVAMQKDATGENVLPCKVLSASYLGSHSLVVAEMDGAKLRVETTGSVKELSSGFLKMPREAVRLFPVDDWFDGLENVEADLMGGQGVAAQ